MLRLSGKEGLYHGFSFKSPFSVSCGFTEGVFIPEDKNVKGKGQHDNPNESRVVSGQINNHRITAGKIPPQIQVLNQRFPHLGMMGKINSHFTPLSASALPCRNLTTANSIFQASIHPLIQFPIEFNKWEVLRGK